MKLKMSTVLVAFCCYLLIFEIGSILNSFNLVFSNLSQQQSLVLLLDSEVTEGEVSKVAQDFRKHPLVKDVKVFSTDEMTEQIFSTLSKLGDRGFAKEDLTEYLGPALAVTAKSPEAVNVLAAKAKQLWQIVDVGTGTNRSNELMKRQGQLTVVGLLIIAILAMASALVIENAIRRDVHARREEIEILELVGASPLRLRWPFVKEALLMNLVALVLAAIVSGILMLGLKSWVTAQEQWVHLSDSVQMMPLFYVITVVLIASLFSLAVAYRSVRSINSGWSGAERSHI